MWGKTSGDGCAADEKERKTDVEMDEQHQGRLERKGSIGLHGGE